MKYLILITALCVTPALKAGTLSSCQDKCYQAKHACNTHKGHTFNNCDHDLFTCKASCNSGNKERDYSSKLPLDVAFHPILDVDLKKMVRF